MTSAFLEVKLRHLLIILTGTALWCLEATSSAHLLIIRQGEWHGKMKRNEEFTAFRSVFIVKGMRKILPYALKIRQDYLSTRYLDQFITWINSYLPRLATLTREIFLIQVTSAEIILSHLEGIW